MAENVPINAQIDEQTKAEAEEILASLGLNPSLAIDLFYSQIILHNGLPFEVTNVSPNDRLRGIVDENQDTPDIDELWSHLND